MDFVWVDFFVRIFKTLRVQAAIFSMLVNFLLRPHLKEIINIYFIYLLSRVAISLQMNFPAGLAGKFGLLGKTFSNSDHQLSSTAELSAPW